VIFHRFLLTFTRPAIAPVFQIEKVRSSQVPCSPEAWVYHGEFIRGIIPFYGHKIQARKKLVALICLNSGSYYNLPRCIVPCMIPCIIPLNHHLKRPGALLDWEPGCCECWGLGEATWQIWKIGDIKWEISPVWIVIHKLYIPIYKYVYYISMLIHTWFNFQNIWINMEIELLHMDITNFIWCVTRRVSQFS